VPADDINVAADAAYCRGCGELTKLSDLLGTASAKADDTAGFAPDAELDAIDTADIPSRCVSRHDGLRHLVRVTRGNRLSTIVGSLAVMLFWNGIVSVFVLLALSSSVKLAGLPMPTWFPAPEMNDQEMGLGMTLFLWVFLMPFIVIGSGMLGTFLLSLLGRVEVTLEGDDGTLFQGVGPIGWRRRFKVADVTGVGIGQSSWESNGQHQPVITIHTRGGGKLSAGAMLTARRRAWLAAELRRVLSEGTDPRPTRRY
jgi:hypothetical protein